MLNTLNIEETVEVSIGMLDNNLIDLNFKRYL